MGHGKETPRQKMIGIMYLFLTCMLALNVSKDVLNAFSLINGKLHKTNANFTEKNQVTYDALEEQAQINPAKAGEAHKLAQVIKERSKSLVDSMQMYKHKIICTADGLNFNSLELNEDGIAIVEDPDNQGEKKPLEDMINSKDNVDIAAQIMVLQKEGEKLQVSVEAFRSLLINAVQKIKPNADLKAAIETAMSTESVMHHGVETPWVGANFEHIPLIAAVTNLTQLQTTTRNVEGDVIKYMYGQLDAESFKFNKLSSTVIPKSSYVMQGNKYSAEIFLAASDTTQSPEVYIGKVDSTGKGLAKRYFFKGDSTKVPVDTVTGKALFEVNANSVGEMSYEGIIRIPKPGSTTEKVERYFKQSYIVAKPSLVISPTKMNVFYIGVDNPVDISVPGVPGNKIRPSITQGTISKKGGDSYIVKVRKAGTCRVNVSADFNGKQKPMGGMEFRIKKVPDPVPIVAGEKGGLISASLLQAAKRVDARLENFDFDLRFDITGFTISTKTNDGYTIDKKSTSNKITSEQRQMLDNIRKGQKVYFEEVTARGPDGTTRELGTIMFKVK